MVELGTDPGRHGVPLPGGLYTFVYTGNAWRWTRERFATHRTIHHEEESND